MKRAFFLFLFLFLVFSFYSFAQITTWEKIEWFDTENPFRKIKKDSKGNSWELKYGKLYKFSPDDTLIFPIDASSNFGMDFYITSSDEVFVSTVDGAFKLTGNKIAKVSLNDDYYHTYGYGSKTFYCNSRGKAIYSLNALGEKKYYDVEDGMTEGQYANRRFFSDNKHFLILCTTAGNGPTVIHMYDSITDQWSLAGTQQEVYLRFMHNEAATFMLQYQDTLSKFNMLGFEKISLRDDSMGNMVDALGVPSNDASTWILYSNGLRSWFNGWKNFSFKEIPGMEQPVTIMNRPVNAEELNYPQLFPYKKQLFVQVDSAYEAAALQKKSYFFLYDKEQLLYKGAVTLPLIPNALSAQCLQRDTLTNYLLETKHNQLHVYKNGTKKWKLNGPQANCSSLISDDVFLWALGDSGVYRMAHEAYYISGIIYFDKDKNGIKDQGEQGTNKVVLKITPGKFLIYPDDQGYYSFGAKQNMVYQITVEGKNADYLETQVPLQAAKNENNNIGIQLRSTPPVQVLTLPIVRRSRCNTTGGVELLIINEGFTDVDSVAIKLTLEEPVKIASTTNGELSSAATYFAKGIAFQQKVKIPLNILWPGAAYTAEKFTLTYTTSVFTKGALVSTNAESLDVSLRCSYDPNEKTVSSPESTEDKTTSSAPLTYTIHFENTGNDTAFNVRIEDTLDVNLDPATFQVLTSSHPMQTSVLEKRNIHFLFSNINLPDTITNNEAAQGYVVYRVNFKDPLASGTQVRNTAYIYFDENTPIRTNTAIATKQNAVSVITGLSAEDHSKHLPYLFPNPAETQFFIANGVAVKTLHIYSAEGRLLYETEKNNVDIQGFQKGLYLVKFFDQFGKYIGSEKFVIAQGGTGN